MKIRVPGAEENVQPGPWTPTGAEKRPSAGQGRDPFKEYNMDFDEDKIDEYTLALLYLVTHAREEGFGARVWKGFDWDTLNRLHAKGYISDPIGKAKSVAMSEDGFLKARELCERLFAGKASE